MDSHLLIIECIILAFAAGLVYGVFGSGSGLIMTPGFYYILRHFSLLATHQMQVAIATTAAASEIIGLFSAYVQWRVKNIDKSIVKQIIPGLAVGTVLAVLLLNVFSSALLKHLFGILVMLVSVWLWLYKPEKDKQQWRLSGATNFWLSLLIGILWFLFGIALFTVPYLHKCGVAIKNAVGAASVTGSLFSAIAAILLIVSGSFIYGISLHQIGYINGMLFAIALVPSAIAGYLGTKITHRLPQKPLKKIYSSLLMLVGLLMLI